MRWVLVFSVLAGVMFVAERRTFPASRHLELLRDMEFPHAGGEDDSADRGNAYQRAFAWIGSNTPKDALFAMDAQYITKPGEDAQNFRAIAGRSVLPDFSKDGGVATNKPELAAEWLEGQLAQAGLGTEPAAQRIAVLKPLGVTWVVLERKTVTAFECVYANEAVKVCRLP